MTDERREQARELFHAAYVAQMQGRFEQAVELYKGSIAASPSAEAYTFLGWTYHFQGKVEQAIEECKNAITIDPAFGNPYNDIGSYLIEQQKFDEAIPWLERAIRSARYDAYHYAWYNLGTAHEAKEMYTLALQCYSKALEMEPLYTLASEACERLRRVLQDQR